MVANKKKKDKQYKQHTKDTLCTVTENYSIDKMY